MASVPQPLPGSPEWRDLHGIRGDVYKARHYTRWTKDDLLHRSPFGPSGVVDAIGYEFFIASESQWKWAQNQALDGSASGLIMRAHAIPGTEGFLPPIPPQLRHDVPGTRRYPPHYHPYEWPEGYVPHHPKRKAQRLPGRRCGEAWEWRRHILGTHGHQEAVEAADKRGFTTPELVRGLLADADRDPAAAATLREILREAAFAYETEHDHERARKYLLPIRPTKEWRHDHATAYADSERALRRHLKKYHPDGENPSGEHGHGEWPDEDIRRAPGRRLDMNPLAWQRLTSASVVFFVIEGKIKADAVLSHIIEHDLSASVFDVPSVGQWDAPELEWFVGNHLRGKTVVIVPDADWHYKDEVITQALLCRNALEDFGLRDVCIAAPPSDRLDEGIKGVDDYLGSEGGGSLAGLQVIGLGVPQDALDEWARGYAQTRVNGRKISVRRVQRDTRALKGLILLAGPMGQTNTQSFSRYARFMRIDRHIVTEAIHSLLAMELPPIKLEEGTLDVGRSVIGAVRAAGRRTRPRWSDIDDWLDRPKLTILDPALRAIERPAGSLAERLSSPITAL